MNTPSVLQMMMVSCHKFTQKTCQEKLYKILPLLLYSITDPFEVGFVETIYTVPESVCSVEVCVNLTRPTFDIFEEFVVVEVYDFPSSVVIPANVILASEPALYMHAISVFSSLCLFSS